MGDMQINQKLTLASKLRQAYTAASAQVQQSSVGNLWNYISKLRSGEL